MGKYHFPLKKIPCQFFTIFSPGDGWGRSGEGMVFDKGFCLLEGGGFEDVWGLLMWGE